MTGSESIPALVVGPGVKLEYVNSYSNLPLLLTDFS